MGVATNDICYNCNQKRNSNIFYSEIGQYLYIILSSFSYISVKAIRSTCNMQLMRSTITALLLHTHTYRITLSLPAQIPLPWGGGRGRGRALPKPSGVYSPRSWAKFEIRKLKCHKPRGNCSGSGGGGKGPLMGLDATWIYTPLYTNYEQLHVYSILAFLIKLPGSQSASRRAAISARSLPLQTLIERISKLHDFCWELWLRRKGILDWIISFHNLEKQYKNKGLLNIDSITYLLLNLHNSLETRYLLFGTTSDPSFPFAAITKNDLDRSGNCKPSATPLPVPPQRQLPLPLPLPLALSFPDPDP